MLNNLLRKLLRLGGMGGRACEGCLFGCPFGCVLGVSSWVSPWVTSWDVIRGLVGRFWVCSGCALGASGAVLVWFGGLLLAPVSYIFFSPIGCGCWGNALASFLPPIFASLGRYAR